MKRILAMCVIVSLFVGMAVPILAQQETEESTKFIEVLVSELKTLLDADSVLGTQIEFEGTTIIPVVARGFGFGGGSGGGGDEQSQGAGTGVGAGGGVMPLSFLVITKEGEISIIAARKGELGEIIKAAAPMIMEIMKAGQTQQQEEQPAEEEAEQPEQP
jgi:uncharacterized spore protein YtfJ